MRRAGLLVDSHGRVMRDLRISVTDRCNFRCLYCLPETEAAYNFYRGRWANVPRSNPITHQWAERSNILSFEEITRFAAAAIELGIDKIRLTGGEPLLRRELEKLVAQLARLDGAQDLALTTNGFHFAEKAVALRDAGLNPEQVQYLNAHATSTPLGDKAETIAMKRAFGEHAYRMAVSSTKSMTGHLLGAAGVVEAVFSVLALRDQVAPPTINLTTPDPDCDLDFVPNAARPMRIDVAMSNSFGFGGTNGTLVFRRI